jgi:hypothetical protein
MLPSHEPLLVMSIGTLCVASTALATTYVRVEKDGTKTYSDRPLPGGQPVELQPAQSYSRAAAASADLQFAAGTTAAAAGGRFKYDSCTLMPANDSTSRIRKSVYSVSTAPAVRPARPGLPDSRRSGVGTPGAATYTMSAGVSRHARGAATVTNQAGLVICSTSASVSRDPSVAEFARPTLAP